MVPLVSVNHIDVKFEQKTILTDINLTVNQGEIVTLIGPNGAGKSTLVRTVLGLIKPTRGTVRLEKGINIGYMPQKLVVEPFIPLSVHRFLELSGEKDKKRIDEILCELRVKPLEFASIQSISGGEMQRVMLARALLRAPKLLVLDEPAQGVDVIGQQELYRLIRFIRDKYHCGILMVSHDLHLVMGGTDSVICLNKHICCSGHPETVSRHPEFLNLFGIKESEDLAIYAHRHNHTHDFGGDVCP